MPGTPLDAATIVARFNSLVRNSTTQIGNATWYSGNHPGNPDSRMGSRTEPAKTTGDIPSTGTGNLAASYVFSLLHGWAMELTRVRRVHIYVLTDAQPNDQNTQLTALKPEFAAYFPIPYHPPIGEKATDPTFNTFLDALRNKVNDIRTNDAYRIDIVTCHSSCHGSCHSSRNRR